MIKTFQKRLRENAFTLITSFVLISLFILTILSNPGDGLYHLKKTWYNAEGFVAPTNLGKATVRLNIAQGLVKNFKEIQSKNQADPKLVEIAKELVGEEQAGIYYLDLAKKEQKNISSQVKILCDGLQTQQMAIYQAYSEASPELQPQLHEVLSRTDVYLSQALEW